MPRPYPKEFRDDVVNVARSREPGQPIKQIAADFGIAESRLRNWMRQSNSRRRHQAWHDRGRERLRQIGGRTVQDLVLRLQQPGSASLPSRSWGNLPGK